MLIAALLVACGDASLILPILDDTVPANHSDGAEHTLADSSESDSASADNSDGEGYRTNYSDIEATRPRNDMGGPPPRGDTEAAPEDGLTLMSDSINTTSWCTVSTTSASCAHNTITFGIEDGLLEPREVHWQLPLGTPPSDGWPVVLLFQGSFLKAEAAWSAEGDDILGTWNRTMTVVKLLEAGYAVLTPETHLQGSTFWDTNIAPYNQAWELAPDHRLMLAIINGLASDVFGAVDDGRLYTAGFSSGGYMASRVALTYTGVQAAAVHSASYMTCAASACFVPALPVTHPPTLFLHGTADIVVPVWTSQVYADKLAELDIPMKQVLEDGLGHVWLSTAPNQIVSWFQAHPGD